MRDIVIQIQKESPMIRFAAERIRAELEKEGCFIYLVGLNTARSPFDKEYDHIIIATKEGMLKSSLNEKLKGWQARADFSAEESYSIWLENSCGKKQTRIVVSGSDEKGAMYGGAGSS